MRMREHSDRVLVCVHCAQFGCDLTVQVLQHRVWSRSQASTLLASSPGRFFQLLNVGGGGGKRPGIHCTGGSARVLNC